MRLETGQEGPALGNEVASKEPCNQCTYGIPGNTREGILSLPDRTAKKAEGLQESRKKESFVAKSMGSPRVLNQRGHPAQISDSVLAAWVLNLNTEAGSKSFNDINQCAVKSSTDKPKHSRKGALNYRRSGNAADNAKKKERADLETH